MVRLVPQVAEALPQPPARQPQFPAVLVPLQAVPVGPVAEVAVR
jgi:hypothetical protein